MGNSIYSSLDDEAEYESLLIEYGWLQNYREFLGRSRISYNFIIEYPTIEKPKFYRFFRNISKQENLDRRKIISNSGSFDKQELQTSLNKSEHLPWMTDNEIYDEAKYIPSFNGIKRLITQRKYDKKFIGNTEKSCKILYELKEAIEECKFTFSTHMYPNVLPYDNVEIGENFLYINRLSSSCTVEDWFSQLGMSDIRQEIVLKWISFQAIISILQLHSCGIFHGDIKCENFLISHILFTTITDLCPWKPIYIDRDDLRLWTIFFEKENSSKCYLAPERFIDRDNMKRKILIYENLYQYEYTEDNCNKSLSDETLLLQKMDIFSLGCTIIEIMNNGNLNLNLKQILKRHKDENSTGKFETEVTDELKNYFANIIEITPKRRPNIYEIFLDTCGMKREVFNDHYKYVIYNFDQEVKKKIFPNAFPLFFYPLSLILSHSLFSNPWIQILLLCSMLPSLLEAILFNEVKILSENVDNYSSKINQRYLPKIEISCINNWSFDIIKDTLHTKIDYELINDIILTIILIEYKQINHEHINTFVEQLYNYNQYRENENSEASSISHSIFQFDTCCLFSYFQLILRYWLEDEDFDIRIVDGAIEQDLQTQRRLSKSEDIHKMKDIEDYLSSILFKVKPNNKKVVDTSRNLNFLINDVKSVSDENLAIQLYLEIIFNCLMQIVEPEIEFCNSDEDLLVDQDIIQSIYLHTLNILDILYLMLGETGLREVLINRILPIIGLFLKLDSFDSTVKTETLNWVNKHINIDNYLNDKDLCDILNNVLINNVIDLLQYGILNKDNLSYNVLYSTIKVLSKVYKIVNDKVILDTWIKFILTSNCNPLLIMVLNKTNKLDPLQEYQPIKNGSVIFTLLIHYYYVVQDTNLIVTDIFPYIIAQLNSPISEIRNGYCQIITDIIMYVDISLFLPYGKFCLEKCLGDDDLSVNITSIECIYKILETTFLEAMETQTVNNPIISFEMMISTASEILTNFKIWKLYIYYQLYESFNKLSLFIIDSSIIMKDWTIICLFFSKFDTNLAKYLNKILVDRMIKDKYTIINIFHSYLKNTRKNKSKVSLLRQNNLQPNSCNTGNTKYNILKDSDKKYLILNYKKRAIFMSNILPINSNVDLFNENTKYNSKKWLNNIASFVTLYYSLLLLYAYSYESKWTLNLDNLFKDISTLQSESKKRLRSKYILKFCLDKLPSVGNLTTIPEPRLNNTERENYSYFKIRGNYKGSIYIHEKSVKRNGNNIYCNGFDIYTDISYRNSEIYLWSCSNMNKSCLYLHKYVHNEYSWKNVNKNDQYVYRIPNGSNIANQLEILNWSYCTGMVSQSNNFGVVIGTNKGKLLQIFISDKPHTYEFPFTKYNSKNIQHPSIILLKKLNSLDNEFATVYSNGQVSLNDFRTIKKNILTTIPPELGYVTNICTDCINNKWICVGTSENFIIIFDIQYIRNLKVWKIIGINLDTKDIRINGISNGSICHNLTRILLSLDNNTLILFDWVSGEVISNYPKDSDHFIKFQQYNQMNKYIDVYATTFSQLHSYINIKKDHFDQYCDCLYCITNYIRKGGMICYQDNISLNFNNVCTTLNEQPQYNYYNQYHTCQVGPIATENNSYSYLLGDSLGNIFQYINSNYDGQLISYNCIVKKFDQIEDLGLPKVLAGHKDLVTSISILDGSFYNQYGLITASRDGVVSYWT
ncbi:uncharacterized protein CMU_028870 [Cryptosporidium muris RN66]|uniref:Protein kinase domain-containing protein n=1 Tax=Cryptosporidium muris (strain RN66) TaxID=441375 RepID=B6AHX2_CRYMR|nr:uncharacterized protein CMU_028870 [Cryptosporidium muris RN66]EEA07813.1 hypothetical protein, conserved [Cryptosporidium muris RN66]|eukprot:XP_002142162.1 hypothetical protein [Cryptosporidium muris RN66]